MRAGHACTLLLCGALLACDDGAETSSSGVTAGDAACADAGDAAVCAESAPIKPGTGLLYAESFEHGEGGWTTTGEASSWALGRPDKPFIPAAADGERAWVTGLLDAYNSDEASFVESPVFDFSAQRVDPVLSFALLYDLEESYDGAWIELSLDGGASWEVLGAQATGQRWYGADDRWSGSSGPGGEWQRATHRLVGAAGQARVRVRVALSSDADTELSGVGFDDVQLWGEWTDLALELGTPQAFGCAGAELAPITAEVRNLGSVTISDAEVAALLDGERVTSAVVDTLAPGEVASVELELDSVLAAGAHTLAVALSQPGDRVAENDMSETALRVQPSVDGAGYAESFESGAGGWSVAGERSSWTLGQPAGDVIAGAGSGEQAWFSGDAAYNDDELSYLISPCLDLSAATQDPQLAFRHVYDLEPGIDFSWVERSIDGGAAWEKLGTVGSGTRWYDDFAARAWSGTSPPAGVWRDAGHVLEGAAGQAYVLLRFVLQSDASTALEGVGVDDVRLDGMRIDAAVTALEIQPVACAGRAGEQLAVDVYNSGDVAIGDVELAIDIDGSEVARELIDVEIPPQRSYRQLFSLGAELAATGAHTISARVTAAGDADASNDVASAVTHTQAIHVGLGYGEDFEAGDGGWVSFGRNDSWSWGRPGGELISGAASGTHAWGIGLDGPYAREQSSYLVSPCMDLSDASVDPQLEVALIYDLAVSDYAWAEISTDGGARFRRLGDAGSGPGWYNAVPDDELMLESGWAHQSSGAAGTWIAASHPLDGSAGQRAVLIRFGFLSEFTEDADAEGFALDDFVIVR